MTNCMNKTGSWVGCSFCGVSIYRAVWQLKRAENYFCNTRCHDNYLLGKKMTVRSRVKKQCENCGTLFEVYGYRQYSAKFCSKKCVDSWGKGKENGRGIGELACYSAKHDWVIRMKGSASLYNCVSCGKNHKQVKKIEWSNINHKYKKNINDYVARCVSCHRKYDNNLNLIK